MQHYNVPTGSGQALRRNGFAADLRGAYCSRRTHPWLEARHWYREPVWLRPMLRDALAPLRSMP